MARGWESKSVEEQQDLAAARKRPPQDQSPPSEELEKRRQRASLELSRTRVLHDLETVTHQRYRESLEAALKHLEDKIAALG